MRKQQDVSAFTDPGLCPGNSEFQRKSDDPVEVLAGDHTVGRASVPSGASTGKFEATELRDGGARYQGKGVQRAVEHVNAHLANAVIGMNVFDQKEIDRVLCKTDGSVNRKIWEQTRCSAYRWQPAVPQ